jgi:hypothetical protein
MLAKRITLGLGSACLAGIVTAGPAVADPTPTALPIGPNQIYLGLVNGDQPKATFTVACPGPVSTTSIGHPVADTVAVERLIDPIPGFGRTGNATSIAVTLAFARGPVGVVEPVTTFGSYRTKAVPDTLTTPCGGTGVVRFHPVGGGTGASDTTVTVTFVNIAVTPGG